jgi:hypothetical protein
LGFIPKDEIPIGVVIGATSLMPTIQKLKSFNTSIESIEMELWKV